MIPDAPWQDASLGGGHHSAGDAPGNAPGTWVRVALPWAGANWGAALVPRVGAEVAVEFIEGDIDRPLVVGVLYNGQDAPPFAAGEDSGVNHPGVISGWHTHGLDGDGFNQWVLDDATAQLRMRLHCSYTLAEVGLGHLIAQGASGAQRGRYRGAGFEGNTQGWGALRAGSGLLISTSARAGSYGSAQGSQMDAHEASAQLKAARDLGQRLSDAASAQGAQALTSHQSGQALDKTTQAIDPTQDGQHKAALNGQAHTHDPQGGRTGSTPVSRFEQPHVVLDTPAALLQASDADLAHLAGQDLSWVAQGDVQHSAAHTSQLISAETTSLYTHQGGMQIKAANGKVSLRAHTDELKLQAQDAIQVLSVNGEIRIQAKDKIELIGADSSLVLEGGNITMSTPGSWAAKGAMKQMMGGGSKVANLNALPVGNQKLPPQDVELHFHYDDLSPVANAPYKITFADGSSRQGMLDAQGYALEKAVPPGAYTVEYGEDGRAWEAPPREKETAEFHKVKAEGQAAIERMLVQERAA